MNSNSMNKFVKSIVVTLSLLLLVVLASCGGSDITSTLKLDRDFSNKSYMTDGIGEVKLLNSVDGDTANFKDGTASLKVRFYAIDTPESTGDIDKWGLAASKYTEQKLKTAHSIVLESNSSTPESDNYGRDLAFIWYKSSEKDEYRNLCLELVEQGYSLNNGKSNNKYADYFIKAEESARKNKRILWSKDKDPLFSETPTEYSLKYIVENAKDLYYKMVQVDAYVKNVDGKYITLENYIDGKYYTFTVYTHNTVVPFLSIRGNYVQVIGTVQPFNDGYQISGVQYNRLNAPNSKLLKNGYFITFGTKVGSINPPFNLDTIKVSDVTEENGNYIVKGTADRYSKIKKTVDVTITVPKGTIDFTSYIGKSIKAFGYNPEGTKQDATEISITVRNETEISLV